MPSKGLVADSFKNPRIDLGFSPKGNLDKTTLQDWDTVPYPFGRCKCLRVFVYLLALFYMFPSPSKSVRRLASSRPGAWVHGLYYCVSWAETSGCFYLKVGHGKQIAWEVGTVFPTSCLRFGLAAKFSLVLCLGGLGSCFCVLLKVTLARWPPQKQLAPRPSWPDSHKTAAIGPMARWPQIISNWPHGQRK